MNNYYFERLNCHVIHIDHKTEAEVRELWENFQKEEADPNFTMWCVFLLKQKVIFYYVKNTEHLPKEEIVKI